MTTDAELDEKLARLGERVRSRSEGTRQRLAEIGALELAQALRERFDARLVYLGPDGQRPAWLDWPHHTAADMNPSLWPSEIAKVSRETNQRLASSRRGRR